jgi:hypothetical protein
MAKKKVSSKAKKKQAAVRKLLKNKTIQDKVEYVQGNIYRVADSLEFIKMMIYESDNEDFLQDLVPPMLEQRAEYLRERARELFVELGVEPPGK